MSMSLILGHVRNAIKSEFLVPPTSGATLLLTESQKQAKCREVYLSTRGVSFSTQPVLINLDRRDEAEASVDTHPIFNDVGNMKIKCDYALICPLADKIYILLIDLKSNSISGWLDQTCASEQFTRYIISNIDRAHNLKIPYEIIYRHVLFTTHPTISKKRVTGNTVLTYELERNKQVYFVQLPCVSKSTEGHFLKLLLR